jgi:hypothetical protein
MGKKEKRMQDFACYPEGKTTLKDPDTNGVILK